MPYDKDVPADNNLVRGVSGDLAAMQENFNVLEPVATSGLRGLSGEDGATGGIVEVAAAPDADDLLVFSGGAWRDLTLPLDRVANDVNAAAPASGELLAFDGAEWVPSGSANQALDDLTDVATAGATAGQALVFDGANWGPDDVATASDNRMVLTLTGTQSVTTTADTEVVLDAVAISGGTFTANLTSGQVIVGAGVTKVDLFGQAAWPVMASGAHDIYASFHINGAPVSGVAGYPITVSGSRRGSTNNRAVVAAAAWEVPVASGDLITLAVRKTEGGTDTLSGLDAAAPDTWMAVREPGGGGSSEDPMFTECMIAMASGTSETLTTGGAFKILSGYDANPRNTNSEWTVNLTSGHITVPNGVTHITAQMQLRWQLSGSTGVRAASVEIDKGAGFTNFDDISHQVSTPAVPSGAGAFMTLVLPPSPYQQVSGGELLRSLAFHTAGGNLDVTGAAFNYLTFFHIQGWRLASGAT
jgi:hypothetical protein